MSMETDIGRMSYTNGIKNVINDIELFLADYDAGHFVLGLSDEKKARIKAIRSASDGWQVVLG